MKKLLICFYIIFFTSIFSNTDNNNEKIKLYAIFTPSHRKLFDEWFMPSLLDDFSVYVKEIPQECESAIFQKSGWTKTTLKKVDYIIEAIKENWNKVIIYSDVDIIFFRSVKENLLMHLDNYDIAIQTDFPKKEAGTGFFICRCNQATLDVWLNTKKIMEKDIKISDQKGFNLALCDAKELKIKFLSAEYAHGAMKTGKFYQEGSKIYLPKNAYLYHVNYTLGIEKKIKHLLQAKQLFENM